MEIKISSVLAVMTSMMMFIQVFSSPIGDASQGSGIEAEKRPKYMDTKDLDYFKDLIMFSLDELIDDHKINPNIFNVPEQEAESKAEKRGRHLGLCYRRTASGFSAIPCWKNEAQ